MDINRILEELRLEREAIDEVILLLERVEAGRIKRRGRPPRWLQEARNAAAESNGEPWRESKREISEESRLRMAEAQRRRRERERNEAQKHEAPIQPE